MKYLLFVLVLVTLTRLGYGDSNRKSVSETANAEKTTDDDQYDTFLESESQSSEQVDLHPQTSGQFYPSFAPFDVPPLGHSRPFYDDFPQQEGAYSQRAQPPFHQQNIGYDSPVKSYSGYKDTYSNPIAPEAEVKGSNEGVDILGDGNFGVIKGGTFYPQNEHEAEGSNRYEEYGSFFHNGHGRPSFYGFGRPNPKPTRHEQFANFKDFAEINSPPEREYSHYVIVYTNKNDTKLNNTKVVESPHAQKLQPKNIIESLAMLDMESSTQSGHTDRKEQEEWAPEKKLSKSKRKLAKLLPEKKYKLRLIKKKERELHDEPLLALS